MQKNRIENLSDGVFSIVMTLLILEFKLPVFEGLQTDSQIWYQLSRLGFVLLIYFVSFTVLGGYWLSHHFLISVFAKNADRLLTHFNLLFLSLIALIPFSAYLLGMYPNSTLVIGIFAVNVIVIGLSLILVRWHVYKSTQIENLEISKVEFIANLIHLSLPPFFALLAIPCASISTQAALIFFIIPAIINVVPGSLSFFSKMSKFILKHISLNNPH